MKYKKIIVLLILFIAGMRIVGAQTTNQNAGIYALSDYAGDSLTLRWAVDNPIAWKRANATGYCIQRIQITSGGKPIKQGQAKSGILICPLKPWELSRWESLAKSNTNAAIAAQAIYGASFQPKTSNAIETIYNQSEELTQRYSFALFAADQSLKVAEASGLLYTDKALIKGEQYVYKIYMPGTSSTLKVDTAYVLVNTTAAVPALPVIKDLKAEFADRTVMLSWSKEYMERFYTSYSIERSEDNGKTFSKANKLPIVNLNPSDTKEISRMYWVDSLPANGIVYTYRVKGVTAFERQSNASDTVSGKGVSLALLLIPTISKVTVEKNGNLSFSWTFDVPVGQKLLKYQIERSNTANGAYTILNSVSAAQKTYSDSKPEKSNYYVVRAILENGQSVSSFPTLGQAKDETPPLPPEWIGATADTMGKVLLIWKRGVDTDIQAYKIYRGNSLEEEFALVTNNPVHDTMYVDSIQLHTLTKKVYYKISAFDMNFNHSKYSTILEVKRPDIVAPVPPVITAYKADDKSFSITWIPSTSEDVVGQRIYRKDVVTSTWIKQAELQNDIRTYTDTTLKKKIQYEYVLVAYDDSENESAKGNPLMARLTDYGFRPAIENITAKADRAEHYIKLSWTYVGSPEYIQIYRSVKGGQMQLYTTIQGNFKEYKDETVKMNTEYIYQLKVRFSDGGSSVLSKSVIVNY